MYISVDIMRTCMFVAFQYIAKYVFNLFAFPLEILDRSFNIEEQRDSLGVNY